MSNEFNPKDTLTVKILVVGPEKVGKTSLINKYCKNYGKEKNVNTKIVFFKNRKLLLSIIDITQ
ncbi:hypothetical protein EIN_298190, partial [Entamoeba invadens IP1]